MVDLKKSFFKPLVLLTIVFALLASCATKPDESELNRSRLESEIIGKVKFLEESEKFNSIADQMSAYNIPALSLAVIHRGKLEWSAIYQNPDFKTPQPLDTNSIFQAASLSKPVTFIAALRMHAAGDIDLDKNIEDYLKAYHLPPGKQTEANPVTFRNIFSHTSGIDPGGYQGYDKDHPMPSDRDILRGADGVNTQPIAVSAEPGQQLRYSGGAYTLAEQALQDRFNEEFAGIMQNWILGPAGMNNSEFTQPLPPAKHDLVARGHDASGEPIAGGWRNHPEQAAAGLWSNAGDMAKFLIEIYKAWNGQSSVFSRSDIEEMLTHERDGHIYGFILERSGDDISLTHYGGNMGYRTGMTINLTHGNGLVYLTNSDNGGSLGNELLLSASRIYSWPHFKQTIAKRKEVSADTLKELAGEYKWNDQIDLSIRFDENTQRISLFFPNGDEYQLTPIQGDQLNFIHPNTGVELWFPTEDDLHTFTLYAQTAVKLRSE